MRTSITIFIISFISIPFFGQNGQSNPNIWTESWLTGNYSYNLNEKWAFKFDEQLRFKNINEPLQRVLSEFKIEHYSNKKVNKNRVFKWGLGYRYYFKKDKNKSPQIYNQFYRYHYQVAMKWFVNRLSIYERIQFQNRREYFENNSIKTRKYWRFKTTISYNIKGWKFDPKFGVEFFRRTLDHENSQRNKYRLFLGTKKKLNKNQILYLKYFYEKEIKPSKPNTVHVVSLKYSYQENKHTKKYSDNKIE